MARNSATKASIAKMARAKAAKRKGNGGAKGAKRMTVAADDAYDKRNRIAENGSKDKALDKRRGVK